MPNTTIAPEKVLNEELLENLHETEVDDSGLKLHMSDNFIRDIGSVISLLQFPKISKIILSFISCSIVIFISGLIFYLIDSVVAPIARILVGY